MRMATVTQASPLRVRVDGAASDSAALLITGAAALNGRVWVDTAGTQLLVIGPAGAASGSAPTKADIDALNVDADTLDGIDSTGFVLTGDTRLTNARTPTAHAASHASGGSDPVTPAAIGAAPTSHTHTASQISDSTATGRSVVTATDAAAARTAIGAGTSSFSGAYSALTGIPTTFAPAAHAASHASGGSDPITVAASQMTATGTRDATTFLRGDNTWATPSGGAAVKMAEFNAGTVAVPEAIVTVTDAAITATSRLNVWQAGEAATGRQVDEVEMERFTAIGIPQTGSVRLVLNAAPGSVLQGLHRVYYTIG